MLAIVNYTLEQFIVYSTTKFSKRRQVWRNETNFSQLLTKAQGTKVVDRNKTTDVFICSAVFIQSWRHARHRYSSLKIGIASLMSIDNDVTLIKILKINNVNRCMQSMLTACLLTLCAFT